jgi:hypothetical protein
VQQRQDNHVFDESEVLANLKNREINLDDGNGRLTPPISSNPMVLCLSNTTDFLVQLCRSSIKVLLVTMAKWWSGKLLTTSVTCKWQSYKIGDNQYWFLSEYQVCGRFWPVISSLCLSFGLKKHRECTKLGKWASMQHDWNFL